MTASVVDPIKSGCASLMRIGYHVGFQFLQKRRAHAPPSSRIMHDLGRDQSGYIVRTKVLPRGILSRSQSITYFLPLVLF